MPFPALSYVISSLSGFCLCVVLVFVMHLISCHYVHCIAYVFVSCIRAFSPLSVLQSDTPMSPDAPFCLFSCAGVKLSRNGPRFAERPWYTTGRPPIKFCAIWRSFDTPTVNRVSAKDSFVCSPTPLPNWPKTHLTPLHALGRSITIAWPKTAPHLDSPSSLYL